MKVIAGQWRGRKLRAPDGATRPSSARLREAVFSALQGRIEGASALDLFAGSGALGIEALSRGASFAEFVEIDARALARIAANLEALGVDKALFSLRRMDAWKRLEQIQQESVTSRIVLLDPPYSDNLPARCLPAGLSALESRRIMAFVLEHPATAPEPDLDLPPGLDLRRRKHGHGAFTLLTRSDR
ncbi:16S rRNA (guanine(966)-N(2))-methyltransferase RsmD [bacterium]|nr:MAG: 16S rRNA (guanine(966)-N(2))-methyltransferase RsmD [bacterium]